MKKYVYSWYNKYTNINTYVSACSKNQAQKLIIDKMRKEYPNAHYYVNINDIICEKEGDNI